MDLSAEQRKIVTTAMNAEGIPGVAVAIVKDSQVVASEGFGYRALDGKLPMTPNTVSPICSLTKSITGVAVMQLVEDGKISLDEPVVSYLPRFRTEDESASRKITPRMLLSHKSGMGRTGHQSRMYEEVVPYKDRADLVSRLAEVKLQARPNATWSYCNEGYVVLGHLIETLSGEPLDRCFQRCVFDIVGMKETFTSFADWRESENRSHTYVKRGDGYEETRLPDIYDIYLSTGGISSTAYDIARYQIATMDYARSPLLTAGSLDQMHTVSMPFGDTGWGWGLGWSIGWIGDRKVVSHAGGLPGVATYSLMVPSEKIGVAVITNLEGAGVGILAEELAGTVLGEPMYRKSTTAPLPFRTCYRITEADLAQYAGAYRGRDADAVVQLEDGLLGITFEESDHDPDEALCRSVGEDMFLDVNRGSVVHFVRNAKGQVDSLLSGGDKFWRGRI